MNWEETIQFIRTKPEYEDLVKKAYLDEDIAKNIDLFKSSEEFIETLRLLKTVQPNAKKILDIGCGNGISAVAFALEGYQVTAVEPDPSETIGAGAIRKMKIKYNLDNLAVYEAFAEDISFDTNSFDVVYIRQAMHHANNLDKFIEEAGRVLKSGGILFTVRDHVIFDAKDKERFLENHPLHKFYGGENAFTPGEYKSAMKKAGLNVLQEIKHFENVINFFPNKKEEVEKAKRRKEFWQKFPQILFKFLPGKYTNFRNGLNERSVSGRMYTYIAKKEQ